MLARYNAADSDTRRRHRSDFHLAVVPILAYDPATRLYNALPSWSRSPRERMARNLGGAIIDLLDSERVDLRAAAATVLAAVGKGDRSVEAALTSRLADHDVAVRRIALEGLADMGAGGIAT
jgi:hypothetical protein